MVENNIHRHMLNGVENFYDFFLICIHIKLMGYCFPLCITLNTSFHHSYLIVRQNLNKISNILQKGTY